MKAKKEIIPLPFPAYYIPTLILALGGLADSIYLAVSHYRVYTDIGYSSFCAISKSINCDTVSQSPFSILFNVPVPVWGVLGYLVFALILVVAWGERRRPKDGWALLQVLAFFFSLYSVILAFISTYFVHSYCIMCIISYGINLALLFYTSMIRRRFKLPPLFSGLKRDLQMVWYRPPLRWAVAGILATAAAGILFFPAYWHLAEDLSLDAQLPTGVTEEGHPWIGATAPRLEIVEYTDYLCFQCRKMHRYLRQLVARYPDRIRLVHRHFPMDHTVNAMVPEPFHVGSGNMALLALYATEQEKFWEMNDALYAAAGEKTTLDLKKLSDQTGLNLSGIRSALTKRRDLRRKLTRDIRDGIKREITGTPAYVIDGQVHLGQIPPDIIDRALP
ncbi:MAG: vitamin K epoxide reductase family protein [Desulfobacterales bacterium]|nr:vitamin K epoxide reductase family protein [Desulfobacterales bacterium]